MLSRSTVDDAWVVLTRNKLLLKARYDLGQGTSNFGCYHANERALNIVPRS